MPWFNVDDGLHSHPKALDAGNAALGLWVRLGSYSARYPTLEGHIPRQIVASFGTRAERDKLIAAGMLHADGNGYRLHDYLDYNRTAEQVEREREKAAERKRRQRERQDKSHDSHGGSHGVTGGGTHGGSHKPQAKPSQAKVSTTTAAASPPVSDSGDAAAAAVSMLVEHKILAGEAEKPTGFRRVMPARLLAEHGPDLAAHLAAHPDATPADLARHVLGLTELDLHRLETR